MTNDFGSKLVITIPIKIDPSVTSVSGNTVYTNGTDSGIYTGTTQIGYFTRPSITLYNVEFTDGNGTSLKKQVVLPNGSATAPDAPIRRRLYIRRVGYGFYRHYGGHDC
jgi:hypothetical protein